MESLAPGNSYDVRVPYKERILGSATYNICYVGRGAAVLACEAIAKVWDLFFPCLAATTPRLARKAHEQIWPREKG